MNIELKEDQIKDQISKAIVESAIGKTIITAINESLTGYKAPGIIKDAIKGQITLIAKQLIRDEFQDIIKSKIKEQMTDKLIDDLVNGYINKFHDIDWENI